MTKARQQTTISGSGTVRRASGQRGTGPRRTGPRGSGPRGAGPGTAGRRPSGRRRPRGRLLAAGAAVLIAAGGIAGGIAATAGTPPRSHQAAVTRAANSTLLRQAGAAWAVFTSDSATLRAAVGACPAGKLQYKCLITAEAAFRTRLSSFALAFGRIWMPAGRIRAEAQQVVANALLTARDFGKIVAATSAAQYSSLVDATGVLPQSDAITSSYDQLVRFLRPG
jgi:hypothetical protein